MIAQQPEVIISCHGLTVSAIYQYCQGTEDLQNQSWSVGLPRISERYLDSTSQYDNFHIVRASVGVVYFGCVS